MMFGFYTSVDPKQDLTGGGLAATEDANKASASASSAGGN